MHLLVMISLLSVLSYTLAGPVNNTKMFLPSWGADDCDWAGKYMPWTYMDCFSDSTFVLGTTDYTIRLTGTGQLPSAWCDAFYNAAGQHCGVSFSTNDPWSRCNWGGALTSAETLDGDDGWIDTILSGIEMNFSIRSSIPFNDRGHYCIAQAVRSATCSHVQIASGAHCFAIDYYNQSITEYYTQPSPSVGETIIG
jgi:hypothetical protein